MKSEYRACISYLAGRLILDKDTAAMYECLEGRHLDAAELMEKNNISLLEVRPPLKKPVPFDELGVRYALYNSRSGEIYLNISGNTFRGYSASDCSLFMGKASGNLVVIYDYRGKSFFKYRFCTPAKAGGICGSVCRDCGAGKIKSDETQKP